jgi:hypothetical protein
MTLWLCGNMDEFWPYGHIGVPRKWLRRYPCMVSTGEEIKKMKQFCKKLWPKQSSGKLSFVFSPISLHPKIKG